MAKITIDTENEEIVVSATIKSREDADRLMNLIATGGEFLWPSLPEEPEEETEGT